MSDEQERDGQPDAEPDTGSERFKHLPEPIRLEDTVESKDTRVARDPEDGRNTDTDFMIRYSGG
ncbi:MAG TPA: hypothetical protein VGL21_16850 [Jatrophihabitantaceae bacterium]|jgi:hypothetical protein